MAQSREEALAKKRVSEARRRARFTPEQKQAKAEYDREYSAQRKSDPRLLEARRVSSRKHSRKSKGMANATGETRIGTCPICLKSERKLRCDHNHVTGRIRGWLCAICNPFIGQTDADALGRAARIAAYINPEKP